MNRLRWLWASVTRIASGLMTTGGLMWAGSDVALPDYEQIAAMSTLARFPWVWTCVQAIASDMAGIPLVAVREVRTVSTVARGLDGNREDRRAEVRRLRLVGAPNRRSATTREIVDDAVLERLQRPNAGTSGYLFRKQQWVDFLLTGNSFVWAPEGRASIAFYRLHPKDVEIVPGPLGLAAGFRVEQEGGGFIVLPPDQVLHTRDVSWQDTVAAAWGETPIRCLHDDLVADIGARQTGARQLTRGRPDLLFSIKGQVGPGMTDKLKDRWDRAATRRDSAFVVGDDVTATPLSWSPQDLGEADRATRLRDTTLAVFGVPPTRAGISSASYGGSRQESRIYWEGNRARGVLFEDTWSQLAGAGVRIEHDYSAVEALQVSYTERLMRVSSWVGLGARPIDAAEYEGFDESPLPQDAPMAGSFTPAKPIDRQPTEPQADRQQSLGRIRAAVLLHLRVAEVAYAEVAEASVEVNRGLFTRWQTERLFHELDEIGVPPEAARWIAEEECGVLDELVRAGAEEIWTEERADRIAQRIVDWLAREAA